MRPRGRLLSPRHGAVRRRGRRICRASSRFSRNACGNGRSPIPGPGGSFRGCRSRSVSASLFIFPRNVSRSGGRDRRWRVAAAVSAFALRARPVAFPVALAIAAIAAGFTTATFKSLRVEHAVLAAPAGYAEVSGFVENREERERTDRFLLRVHRIDAGRAGCEARTGAAVGPQGNGAGSRLVRHDAGAAQSAAASAATRRLRFCARPLFSGHRRNRLCAWPDQGFQSALPARISGSPMRRPFIPCAMPSTRAFVR